MNGDGYFEVLLDLPNTAEANPMALLNKNQFDFFVENVRFTELKNCKAGDYVKFWEVPDEKRIIIYRKGSVGGDGEAWL